jgi:uncharacterized protein
MFRLLQLVALIILFRFIWRALIRLMGGGTGGSRVGGGSAGESKAIYGGQMVRDPVCGVYVPKQTALVEHRNGRTHYFCSETCRDAFLRGKAEVE